MALTETPNWRCSSSANCASLDPAASYQDQVVMIMGEQLGQFVSDAAGCTGDESGLTHKQTKFSFGEMPCDSLRFLRQSLRPLRLKAFLREAPNL